MTFDAADHDLLSELSLDTRGPTPKFTRDKHSDAHHVRMIRADDGGALRTFNGGLAHENGWYTSRKAGRVLHWQGAAQYDFLTRAEVEFAVVRLASESVRFEFTRRGKKQVYTIDVELVAPDGTVTLIEIKRDERDLADPEYRAKLTAVREICDGQGIRFKSHPSSPDLGQPHSSSQCDAVLFTRVRDDPTGAFGASGSSRTEGGHGCYFWKRRQSDRA